MAVVGSLRVPAATRSGPRILFIRMSAIGDVLFALPALRALRRAQPEAHIAWLVEDRAASIVERIAEVDECLVFPRRRLAASLRSPLTFLSALSEAAGFYSGLRRRRFDVSLDLQGNLKSGLAVLAAGAPRRIGFSSEVGREGNSRFHTEWVTPAANARHRMDRDLALVGSLGGAKAATPELHFPVPEAARDVARGFFETVPSSRPRVILNPSTSAHGAFKRWGIEKFAELGDRLHREVGAAIVLSFGPRERAIADGVRRRMSGPAWLVPDTDSLPQLAAILELADLVVGGDTGPVHLAEAVGTPVVVVFGPQDPVVYGPRLSRSVAVSASVACSPCRRRSCARAFCMDFVGVEEVMRACRSALGRPAP